MLFRSPAAELVRGALVRGAAERGRSGALHGRAGGAGVGRACISLSCGYLGFLWGRVGGVEWSSRLTRALEARKTRFFLPHFASFAGRLTRRGVAREPPNRALETLSAGRRPSPTQRAKYI